MPKYWGGNYFAHGRFPEVGQKQKTEKNTPGTAGGPGGRDRTLAVKSKKIARKSAFFAFDPIWRIFHVRNNFPPNIFA